MKTRTVTVALAAMMMMAGTSMARADYFGAIAYSPNSGAHGYSYDYGSQGEAEAYAMNECRKYAGDCRVAIWFRNACGALAIGNNGGWGSGWGNNQRRAELEAINTCQQYTSNCRIKRWACTTR
ncbi:MAG: DUF4189 domain-containing protein [Nitratireductor sp.]